MAKSRHIKYDELPERYRRQIDKKTNRKTASKMPNMESSAGNAAEAKNKAQGRLPCFDQGVVVTVRSYRHRLADWDGICFKWFLDALVYQGILRDDSPEIITKNIVLHQICIETWEVERTEIELNSSVD